MRSNSDEVGKNDDCLRNLHLTTAYGGASPQGEALDLRSFSAFPLRGRWHFRKKMTDEVENKEFDKPEFVKLIFSYFTCFCEQIFLF